MNKIPCLFTRLFDDRGRWLSISPEVTPGCEWVLAGEGVATRKRDGTACAVIGGRLYKRLDVKNLPSPPPGWIPCERLDGKAKPGWLPVGEGPEDRWHRETWEALIEAAADGTYELCGPKVGGNPEGFEAHVFIRHGSEVLDSVPRDFEGLRTYLSGFTGEGIVWHHPDGRMAKLRRDDFGFSWGRKGARK